MDLETARFGTLHVDDKDIIAFTQPIIGFQEYRRFVILEGPENSIVEWLQSTDSGDLAFLIMDPKEVMSDYAVSLGKSDLAELAVSSVDELDIYTLVVVPHDQKQIRTNLKAPILVNPKQRLAKQIILDRSDYPIRFKLTQLRSSPEGEAQMASGGG